MPPALTSRLITEPDAMVRQSAHLLQDFPSRASALVLCMIFASVIVPIWWLAASLATFAVTELTQFLLHRRLIAGKTTWERPAFTINAFLAAAIFSSFPILIWNSGTSPGYIMGLTMMVTAIMHCVLVRAHHLGVCLASLGPLMAGTTWMVAPRFLAPESGAGGGAMTSVSLVSAVLYCGVCVFYMVHAAIEQHRAQHQMSEALCRAEAANRAKDRFLTSMSHEIRTPLNGILGIARINLDRAEDERAVELAETLLSSGEILKSMVDDILDHAKIEAGKLDLNPEPMDLRQLCNAIMRLYASAAREKTLALAVEISPDVPPLVQADRLRLHQILANLVSNAVKFTPSGEVRIVASARPADDGSLTLEIAVRDTGKGLTEAEMDILFDAFTQTGDEAELAAKGTGLGLPISRSLARLMGGDISVQSDPGQGACFTLAFPTESAVDAGRKTVPDTSVSALRLDGLSILVVEDNRTNRLILRTFLKEAGVVITEVENGALALEAVRNAAFDLVLMDMRMPVMDGETAFRAMRAEGIETPVIALTANAMPTDRQRYLDMGMDGYLAKPLSKTALFRSLEAYRRDRSQAA